MSGMSASRAGSGRHGREGSLIAGLLAIIVLGSLIALAVAKVDPDVIADAIAHMDLSWIALALALMAAAFFARGESWFAVLAAAIKSRPYARRLDRGIVVRALLIGMAGSAVLPGRLGEGARAWIVARRLGPPSRSFAVVLGTVISQTFLNLLALGSLAVIAVLDSALAKARVEAIAAAVLFPAALIALIFAGPAVLRRLTSVRSQPVCRAARWMLEQLARGREGLAVFRQPKAALHATAAQMAAWGLQLLACYATMFALRLPGHANLAAAAAVLLAVNLTAIVPLTPSNVGVFQAACIAVLHPFGVDASQALAYGLVLQAVEIVDAVVLGGLALVREGFRWDEPHRRKDDRGVRSAISVRPGALTERATD